MRNRVKRVISEGGLALGGLAGGIAGPTVVELIGLAGMDAAVIDLEHNGLSTDQVQLMIIAAEAADVTPIIRLGDFNGALITRLLDMGAQGIQLDGITCAEDAQALADAVRFPPMGRRGLIWNSRSSRYGQVSRSDYAQEANAEMLVKISIDNEAGLEHADEIAAVDGVDIIGVGAHDLSSVLGVVGKPDHPRLVEAIDRVIAAVTATGPGRLALPLGSSAYPRTPEELVKLGASYTNLSPHPEQRLLKSLRDDAQKVRSALAGPTS